MEWLALYFSSLCPGLLSIRVGIIGGLLGDTPMRGCSFLSREQPFIEHLLCAIDQSQQETGIGYLSPLVPEAAS